MVVTDGSSTLEDEWQRIVRHEMLRFFERSRLSSVFGGPYADPDPEIGGERLPHDVRSQRDRGVKH